MKKVAIQGISGSYHDVAARNYFEGEEIEIIGCHSFRDVIKKIHDDASIIGVMAIENTIAGSLLQNHELIRQSGCYVIGEYKLRISHSLAALPGTKLSGITEVNSHPIALMQCAEYLETLPGIKIVEKEDTAMSAQWIAENKLEGHAAVCGKLAAEIYGLEVLAEGIETNSRNFTRFLTIADPWTAEDLQRGITKNKSSLVFSLPHTAGSLSKVLTILSFYDMNLSKIQSLPIIGREWEYLFYVNLTYNDYTRYKQALDAIMPLTKDLKILGEYAEGTQSV
ncbi:MAG: prephenate dehydratase [Tannerella sp.]|jgi:prephenate dehydratase|nr:prephenate dehydratase [Tannerella sp.]